MNLLRARHIALLTVAMAACGSDSSESIDPTATYDVYGERFEPGTAVPAPAVFAEPEAFVGRKAIVEGMASAECADPACLTVVAGAGGRIEIFPNWKEGDEPSDVTGRRIVVSGTLESLPQASADDAPSTRDPVAAEPPDTLKTASAPTFRLRATGLMVEKVRP